MVDFVAEFTTNHMGNMNVLLRMVEKAKEAGADFIKMQKKDVETFYSQEKLNMLFDSPYGSTYWDYRTIFEFGKEDFQRFNAKCKEVGIPWFATVQDIPSLYFMLEFDLPMYKIASSNARNWDFLSEVDTVVPTYCPIVLSVAGSTLGDIERACHFLRNHSLYILHCVAEYPCTPKHLRLGNITQLIRYFANDQIKIGYSGHDEGLIYTLAAIELGAEMVERHFCLSRHSFVHHIECSLEPDEFNEMVLMEKNRVVSYAVNNSDLDTDAFLTSFGMSNGERRFLENQTYGKDFLGKGSTF